METGYLQKSQSAVCW